MLSLTTEILPGVLLFALLLLAHEAGFRVAQRGGPRAGEGEHSETSTLQGGILALQHQ